MKKVGIIGGIGPQATSFIYQHLIEVAQSAYHAKDNDDYPDVKRDGYGFRDPSRKAIQCSPLSS